MPFTQGIPLAFLIGFGILIPIYANTSAKLLGAGRYSAVAIMAVIQPIAQGLSLPIHYWFGVEIEQSLAGMIFFGILVQLSLFLPLVLRIESRMLATPSTSKSSGMNFLAKNIFGDLRFRVELVFSGLLLGPNVAGQYSVAMTISTVTLSLEQWLLARFYSFAIDATTETDQKLFWKIQAHIILPLLAFTFLGTLLEPLIPLVFGSAFRPAAELLPVAFLISSCVVASVVNLELIAARRGSTNFVFQQIGVLALGMILMVALGTTNEVFFGFWMLVYLTTYVRSACVLYREIYPKT